MSLDTLYRHSLALLTDLYQLTMAYGYWKLGMTDRQAAFHLVFRKNPFGGGFTIAAGLEQVLELMQQFRFAPEDLRYLASLSGNDGRPLFEPRFLDYLADLKLSCDVHAMREGTVVFPQEPLLRVTGSLLQCQLLETPLLTITNFQTLIATKAARMCAAADGAPVFEFGLRRAQGIDGALAASRAAFIGGCAATSNVLAAKLFGIPVKGTHAHSWVMAFDEEIESFRQYAEVMPNNCVFLVDTYDTLEGVDRAVQVARRLRQRGFDLIGIRLDSGDLAYLSIEARKRLDQAGLADAVIVASNDLDERIIASLNQQGAKITVWGIGTKLVTAFDEPALGGVYKLSALRSGGGAWKHKIKLSEQAVKSSTPGILQVRRFFKDDEAVADMIFDEICGLPSDWVIVDPVDPTRRRKMNDCSHSEDLLIPVIRQGQVVYDAPPLVEIRQRTLDELSAFHAGVHRQTNPHQYPVGLEKGLHDLKTKLTLQARGLDNDVTSGQIGT